jgi:hypothetical protein
MTLRDLELNALALAAGTLTVLTVKMFARAED